jgi:hypothetical protein
MSNSSPHFPRLETQTQFTALIALCRQESCTDFCEFEQENVKAVTPPRFIPSTDSDDQTERRPKPETIKFSLGSFRNGVFNPLEPQQ